MFFEALGWYCVGAGSGFLIAAFVFFLPAYLDHMKKKKKFKAYVESLKSYSEKLTKMNEARSKEISELSFRDKEGVLCTVKIVIDHTLTESLSVEDKQHIRDVMMRGEGGSIIDLATSHSVEESAMKKVQQFVFSGNAVAQMREYGIEPDEVVRRMLKASGRIA